MSQASASNTGGFGQLIPPPELAPGPPAGATREQCVAMWFDLVEATDEILLAALRSRYKSQEEVEAAYRQIYARQVEEHDKKVRHMMSEFDRRSRNRPDNHGG
jgi:hypothetical protein